MGYSHITNHRYLLYDEIYHDVTPCKVKIAVAAWPIRKYTGPELKQQWSSRKCTGPEFKQQCPSRKCTGLYVEGLFSMVAVSTAHSSN